jgi:hypothetical protein
MGERPAGTPSRAAGSLGATHAGVSMALGQGRTGRRSVGAEGARCWALTVGATGTNCRPACAQRAQTRRRGGERRACSGNHPRAAGTGGARGHPSDRWNISPATDWLWRKMIPRRAVVGFAFRPIPKQYFHPAERRAVDTGIQLELDAGAERPAREPQMSRPESPIKRERHLSPSSCTTCDQSSESGNSVFAAHPTHWHISPQTTHSTAVSAWRMRSGHPASRQH